MSPIKAFGTVAVMVACFVVIYPRFMHPFVLKAFGLYEPPKKDTEDNMYPPHLKAMPPGAAKHAAAAEDTRKHLRQSPPHPGMRAAAEMQRQQAQPGSGRGMMGVVLPMYAIGIVLYLVYTLFKVFNKPKNDSWDDGSPYENRMETDYSLDRMGLPSIYDGAGDVHNIYNDEQQRKQLERLLTRIDDKNVSVDEMRMLQKRLEETEAHMCRILKAMQAVHSNVNTEEDLSESEVTFSFCQSKKLATAVVGENQNKEEKLDSTSKAEYVGDEKKSAENTETKIRHRRSKYDNEQ
ncbi:unnamed protein product [Candidula unifasciata]|uniref:Resistance to inhibitors of cholinesterase protein 3 N-terminal domain-containing protein n=1 Tax=Candidula unifasciata TaxID=100452 RepID=A0A8S4A225_9EUPU|nr:unnamed protein product [Candidula unifasciata]